MTLEDKEFVKSSVESGIKYGYPTCCINEFIAQTPSVIKRKKKPSKDDLLRFKMAKINGEYSGFVPCLYHAKMIKNRKITLPELIDTEKREELFPFPYGNSLK